MDENTKLNLTEALTLVTQSNQNYLAMINYISSTSMLAESFLQQREKIIEKRNDFDLGICLMNWEVILDLQGNLLIAYRCSYTVVKRTTSHMGLQLTLFGIF